MKTRIIHTKFWSDGFVEDLTPIEKLIFVYLLTNEQVNVLHCYECSDKRIMTNTGCNVSQLSKFKDKFQQADKIHFFNGYVFLKNATKYEKYEGELQEKAKLNIRREFSKEVFDWFINVSSSNYKPLSNPLEGDQKGTETINPNTEIEIINNNTELIRDKDSLIEELVLSGLNKNLVEAEIAKFISYWTEKSPGGKKEKWQMQKTFDVGRRLNTWFNNISKFSGGQNVRAGRNFDS